MNTRKEYFTLKNRKKYDGITTRAKCDASLRWADWLQRRPWYRMELTIGANHFPRNFEYEFPQDLNFAIDKKEVRVCNFCSKLLFCITN